MVSVEYSEAIVEVLDILKYSDDDIVSKIPKKLIEFWERNKSTTYKPQLDHSKAINDMELKSKTRAIIAMLYLNYLCSEEEKNKTKAILAKNEEEYQKELREKYNPDEIFKNNEEKIKTEEKIDDNSVSKENVAMVEYKESIIRKIINKIKRFFKFK